LIASSGIIWESKKQKKRNFEPMDDEDAIILEDAFHLFTIDKDSHVVKLSDGAEADLALGRIVTPYIKDLRRTYNPGLWLHLEVSDHQRMVHAKLNHLQIDCQMSNCMFPNILAPVPPPRSVTADIGKL
jgi:vacuolar protein sorting-associated protein 13A/C